MPSTSRRCQAKTSLRRKSAELQLALEGSVSTHQRAMLGRQLRHVEFLEQEIQELNVEIEERMRPFDAGIDLIDGIGGLGRRSAEAILAETGIDMSRWPTDRHIPCGVTSAQSTWPAARELPRSLAPCLVSGGSDR